MHPLLKNWTKKSKNNEYEHIIHNPRQTADILEKVSWGLVTFILLVSIITSFTVRNHVSGVNVDELIENVEEQPAFPSAPIQQGAPTTEAPTTEVPTE